MTRIPLIQYDIIAEAISHYRKCGFEYIDAPWMIDKESMDATKPPDAELFSTIDGHLVASGEQSFIAMHRAGNLPPGKYLCVTPCFRDEKQEDELHFRRFFKAELIDCRRDQDLDQMMDDALAFFKSYLPVKLQPTNEGYDIVTVDNIELGSYGRRQFEDFAWTYGTAVAEPRLSQNIKLESYHTSIIRKAEVGTIDKVIEEALEYVDAQLQNNPVMGLVELSDIIGAVQLLLEANHPEITLDDLIVMSKATRRAFESGHR